MERETFEVRRRSFGTAAAEYDRFRPSYPREAVAWMLGDEPRRVVDLGAGTGIFSRLVASLGHEVIAVEPDGQMRERLAEASPGVTVVAGCAEDVPLEPESAGAVVAAQAYHWFDNDAAHREIARLLVPGGVFGPVWNVRDDSVDWVRDLTEIVEPGSGVEASVHARIDRDFGPRFAPPERAEFAHSVTHTAASLLEMVRTRSAYLVGAKREQRRVTEETLAVVRDLPEEFELPYVTVAFRVARR